MINCGYCGVENPKSSKFCCDCGKGLFGYCPKCSFKNPLKNNFCSECGASIDSDLKKKNNKAKLENAGQQIESDRLQIVTILFADIKGFTALSEKLDPDQVKFIMDHILKELSFCIELHNGYIDKYMGDAIMAVFGIHQTREDDAFRALKSAVEMQKKMAELSQKIKQKSGQNIQLRIGINTGKAIIGKLGKGRQQDFTVMGDPVNIASRLESASQPGSILISSDTRDLVIPQFNLRALDPIKVKGKEKPLRIYEVLGDNPVEYNSDYPRFNNQRIPFVGREPELKAIISFFEKSVQQKSFHSILLSGEKGIGKSALAFEFSEYLDGLKDSVIFFTAKPNLSGHNTKETILSDLIRRRAGISHGDDKSTIKNKLDSLLINIYQKWPLESKFKAFKGWQKEADILFKESQVFLAYLFGIGNLEHPLLKPFSSVDGSLNQKIISIILRKLKFISCFYPICIYIDDFHLLKKEGLEFFIESLSKELKNSPTFCLFSAQKEFYSNYTDQLRKTESNLVLKIKALNQSLSKLLLETLIPRAKKKSKIPYKKIIEVSEGNPYFIFEICHYLLDKGYLKKELNGYLLDEEQSSNFKIPNSIALILKSRLKQLSKESKNLLYRASVIGFRFWEGILLKPGFGQVHLKELIYKDFIKYSVKSQIPFEAEYYFSSYAIWESCYNSIPKNQKRIIHRGVANWLEDFSSCLSLDIMILVCQHQKRAGLTKEAFESLIKVASSAYNQHNFVLASGLYKEADELRVEKNILDIFSDKDQRVALLNKRISYLENYLSCLNMVGNKISEIIALAKNYIKIIKKSQRKEEDFNLQSKELRQDALRCLWNKRISFEADEISLNEHKEIIKLLGNLEKGPINLNQMRLWSVIFNEFCNGMKFTKLYEESIMTVFKAQNYHIKNQTFKDKESQLLFYEALAKNFLIFKEDLTKSLKFCAKSCQIALKEMGITEQIRCFSTFAIVLLISGNNKLAAQVFDYLLAFQNNLGIRQNRSIYLSNAAECYLNAGYLQTAKSILSDALKELEKESTIHPHQLDVFINFAVLELLFGKNFNASKIIVKTEKFLNKSSINFHRWLRLKALNQWLVFKDLETSEKLIIKALGQESIGSSDILQTKIIYLKVLKESESSNFSKEKQEVEKWLEGRDELENIWNNYLESGNYFPKQIGIKKDKKLPLLKQKQISSLLEDILKKNIKKPKDSLN